MRLMSSGLKNSIGLVSVRLRVNSEVASKVFESFKKSKPGR